jgi:preprotein translocase subunit SecA
VEFINEDYELFERLIARVDEEIAHRLFRVGVARPQPAVPLDQLRTNVDERDATGLIPPGGAEPGSIPKTKPATNPRMNTQAPPYEGALTKGNFAKSKKKIGRNDPCPCGSGLKYKKCGLINAPQHRG